uniref:Protein Y66H1A.5 n=1 Tax=Haemonchus contortus TaxID=6289 RepID=A0A7I4YH53_HAECO
MWFIVIHSLLAGAQSASVEVRPECSACQLISIALSNHDLKNSPQKTPVHFCTKIPYCTKWLTHCEIVKSLMGIQIVNISQSDHRFAKVNSQLESLTERCEKEPHAEVLAGQPAPALCTLCFLIYYFFQFMNNGILQLPLLNLIPQVIQLTCIIIANVNNEITPPVCQALLADGAMPALLKAIADSMGSFYDLIAVQAMGCPSYQTLFGTC